MFGPFLDVLIVFLSFMLLLATCFVLLICFVYLCFIFDVFVHLFLIWVIKKKKCDGGCVKWEQDDIHACMNSDSNEFR